ncbi:MAG: hypothetical protein OCD02_15570 [Spirochaetaceae bacterium]
MGNNVMDKSFSGYSLSFFITAITTAILVVLKESFSGLHDVMAIMTGHHWVTQGIFTIVLFYALTFLFHKKDYRFTLKKNLNFLIWGTVLSSVIITLFFVILWVK